MIYDDDSDDEVLMMKEISSSIKLPTVSNE
jgi:hypothetical protein